MVKVQIKKLREDAVIPSCTLEGDAGLDLYAVSKQIFFDKVSEINYIEYGTGLAIKIPEGYFGAIVPRSSCSKTHLISNPTFGVIDSNYVGEIKVRFHKLKKSFFYFTDNMDIKTEEGEYNIGDRICQFLILPYPRVEFEEVKELPETNRGSGGFGSTGK